MKTLLMEPKIKKIIEKGALIVAWKVGKILNLKKKKKSSEGMLKACCMEGAGEMWLSCCTQINDAARALMC